MGGGRGIEWAARESISDALPLWGRQRSKRSADDNAGIGDEVGACRSRIADRSRGDELARRLRIVEFKTDLDVIPNE
jgi:hypothetical protein